VTFLKKHFLFFLKGRTLPLAFKSLQQSFRQYLTQNTMKIYKKETVHVNATVEECWKFSQTSNLQK
jgi:hypothetical protein